MSRHPASHRMNGIFNIYALLFQQLIQFMTVHSYRKFVADTLGKEFAND